MSKFDTHGGYFAPKDYMRINEGGSHAENPNGGVQVGVDEQGIPNMLEEGEPVYKDYVYSDNIKASEKFLETNNIPVKYKGMLYSEIADDLFEEAEERPNDPVSRNGLEAMLGRLADSQEQQKQDSERRKLERELSKLSPEELEALQQELMAAQEQAQEPVQPQEQMPMPEQQMLPEEQSVMEQPVEQMPVEQQVPVMADGGLLRTFDGGGHTGGRTGNIEEDARQWVLSHGPDIEHAYMGTVPIPSIGYATGIGRVIDKAQKIAKVAKGLGYTAAITEGARLLGPIVTNRVKNGGKVKDENVYDDSIFTNSKADGGLLREYLPGGPLGGVYDWQIDPLAVRRVHFAVPQTDGTAAVVTASTDPSDNIPDLFDDTPQSPGSDYWRRIARVPWTPTYWRDGNHVGVYEDVRGGIGANTVDLADAFGIPKSPNYWYHYAAPGRYAETYMSQETEPDVTTPSRVTGFSGQSYRSAGASVPMPDLTEASKAIDEQLRIEEERLNNRMSPLPEGPDITAQATTASGENRPVGVPDVTAETNVDNEKRRTSGPYFPTLPRYAGAIGSGLLAAYDAFTPADRYTAPRYNPYVPVGHIDLQNQRYDPVDQNMIQNQMLAQGNSTQRALRNSGLGPSTGAAILAADNNTTRNLGTGFLQSWQANNQQRNAVIAANNQAEGMRAQFDYGVDAARQRALNEAQIRNAQNDLMLQRLNYDAEGQKYNALSNQLNAGFNALAGIGRENFAMNQANSNTTLEGYKTLGSGVGAHLPYYELFNPVIYGALGGYLKKIKK